MLKIKSENVNVLKDGVEITAPRKFVTMVIARTMVLLYLFKGTCKMKNKNEYTCECKQHFAGSTCEFKLCKPDSCNTHGFIIFNSRIMY